MCTRAQSVKTPAYVDPKLTGSPPALHGYVRRSSITTSQIQAFLDRYGYGPDGRTEFVSGARDDGIIEFGRTPSKIGTQEYLPHEAGMFAADLESHFPGIEVSVL